MLSVQIFSFNPFQQNTYVIYNEDNQAIIIDPGCYSVAEETALLNFVQVNKLDVVQLINTHCHIDHVLGNRLIAATFSLELFIHPNEEQVLQFAPQAAKMYGIHLEHYSGPLHYLNEGDRVKLGDDELEIILTPGHSPGSICLYSKKDALIIAGDVIFRDSIGRTDLPGGNHAALLESVREKLFTLPDNVTVYPGHGPKTTIGYEKLHNPFFN